MVVMTTAADMTKVWRRNWCGEAMDLVNWLRQRKTKGQRRAEWAMGSLSLLLNRAPRRLPSFVKLEKVE